MPDDRATWVDAEIDKLLSYVHDNAPCAVIAECLERSEASVYSFCYRNNITLPRKASPNARIQH